MGSTTSSWANPRIVLLLGRTLSGFSYSKAYEHSLAYPLTSLSTLLRPPIAHYMQFRNINLLPITYAFRPRLRIRLTLGGWPWPRKPWIFGGGALPSTYRYSCQHNHFLIVHSSLQYCFSPLRTLLYRTIYKYIAPIASVRCLSPVTSSARERLISELLRFL